MRSVGRSRLPRRFTVTGTPGAPAVYNGETTYNGQPLGVVLATTSVTAGIPGPEVTNPASTTTAAGAGVALSAAAPRDELGGGSIACVVVVAIAAVVIIIVTERHSAGSNPYNKPRMSMSAIGAEPHYEHSVAAGAPVEVVTGMELGNFDDSDGHKDGASASA